jgi:hypothetical protein
MTDEPDSIIAYLRRLDAKVDRSARMDRIETRLERIERRLELIPAP